MLSSVFHSLMDPMVQREQWTMSPEGLVLYMQFNILFDNLHFNSLLPNNESGPFSTWWTLSEMIISDSDDTE